MNLSRCILISLIVTAFVGCIEPEGFQDSPDDFQSSPAILKYTPTENATGVGADTRISVRFSQNIDTTFSLGDSLNVVESGRASNVPGTVHVERDTLVFVPSKPLELGLEYRVSLATSIYFVDGSSIDSVSWSFTTKQAPAPERMWNALVQVDAINSMDSVVVQSFVDSESSLTVLGVSGTLKDQPNTGGPGAKPTPVRRSLSESMQISKIWVYTEPLVGQPSFRILLDAPSSSIVSVPVISVHGANVTVAWSRVDTSGDPNYPYGDGNIYGITKRNGSWTSVQKIYAGGDAMISHPGVSINSSGQILVAWTELPPGSNDFFGKIRRFSPDKGWQPVETFAGTEISLTGIPPTDMYAWLGNDGTAVLVWADYSFVQSIRYSPSSGWGSVKAILNNDAGAPLKVQAASNTAGDIVVIASGLFFEGSNGVPVFETKAVNYSKTSGFSVPVTVRLSGANGATGKAPSSECSVTIAENGNAAMAWTQYQQNASDSGFTNETLTNEFIPGEGWSGASVVSQFVCPPDTSGIPAVERRPCQPGQIGVTYASDGRLIALFSKFTAQRMNVFRSEKPVLGSWSDPELMENVNTGPAGTWVSIAANSIGNIITAMTVFDGSYFHVWMSAFK